MPWYATAYLLLLGALAVASWQFADRLPEFVPGWLRNGDLLAAAGQIVLTCAYWNDGLREALGIGAVPIFGAVVGWMLFAVGPAVETARALVSASGGSEGRAVLHGYAGTLFAFVVATPALFCGFRIARAALGM
ncbi:MAG: hypothetical protein ACK51F_13250 [Rhodospirillales bacterium]|jgi:hypothetical protein